MSPNFPSKNGENRPFPRTLLSIRSDDSLHGEISTQDAVGIPGDKSISHRAALFASLAEGESKIRNFLVSGVTMAMLNALTNFGIEWELKENILTVGGKGIFGFSPPEKPIDCGNSGTTMRLLAGAIAASGVSATLDGSEGLRRRPMKRIIDPLTQMGVRIAHAKGHAPLKVSVEKLPLQPIEYEMPVASAQVKTCLILAALSANGESVIYEPEPSRDHTELMLRKMGVWIDQAVTTRDGSIFRPNYEPLYLLRIEKFYPDTLNPLDFSIPGDVSAASFIIVAGLIVPGSEILLRGIGLNRTRTGLLDVLRQMGAHIRIRNEKCISRFYKETIGDIYIRSSQLYGVEVSGSQVVRMIDEFPIFAIAAACAKGRTIVKNAKELRYKESDRIAALCRELQKIGVQVTEKDDGFEIEGGTAIKGGVVDPHRDHRLAMSLAIAGLVSEEPVIVEGAEIIHESFPDFAPLLEKLGAQVDSKVVE